VSAVTENLAAVRERIDRAAIAAGRDPASVRLVAVSKKKPAEAIREAYAAGQRVFGENYAQEMANKADELSDLEDLEWHFIGHLQSNKAKLVAPRAAMVHAVDGAFIARELARRAESAGRTSALSLLVEVNIGGEERKHGVRAEDLKDTLSEIARIPNVVVRGLMTMPPADDLERARSIFEILASLRSLHGGVEALPELSMGMSGDLEVAIAAGATMVRVGTAIFGAR
jgi:pyridoxal phosphate enzyme (YggS family)